MDYDIFPWEEDDDDLLSQSKNHQDAMLTDSNDFLSLIRIIVNQATRSGSLSKAQIENMARAQIIDNIVGNADTELYS